MAIMRLSLGARNALAKVYCDLIDAGGEPGTISLYTGPQPNSADAQRLTRGQTLLATLSFALPSARVAEDGSIEFAPSEQALVSAGARASMNGKVPWIIEADAALVSGKVEWARIQDSSGNVVFDCDVTSYGEGGMMEINGVDLIQGGPVRLANLIITVPAS